MKIGMIGAGRLGRALAQRLVAGGHEVMISNSRGVDAVSDIAADLGCRAGSARDAARFGDVVVVSVPLKSFGDLPAEDIGRRIVIDTCNYYPGRDGIRAELEKGTETTSGLLQKALPKSTVVKAFNSILAAHLARGGAETSSQGRHAIPIASNDADAAELVAGLVRDAGFDAVQAGPLAESWKFERARPSYCRPLDAAELRAALERTVRSDFVEEGSWRAD
jgi:8-hydroxy-5-deazaflavin:NADPH oxidoreductase